MFEDGTLTLWAILILAVAYVPLLLCFFLPRAFWPCLIISAVAILTFSALSVFWGENYLPLAFALCLEGTLLYVNVKSKGEAS